jgi:putative ABC transport system permease protein
MTPGNKSQTINFINQTYSSFDHKNPFDYFFLSDRINEQYRTEQKMASIFKYFALLTLLIACLGLFGLSSYIASQRTKELGIRKVMGATKPNLVYILTKNFLTLVVIANILSIVLAYFAMDKWLQNFAYATQVKWFYFVFAVVITLVIAVFITSFKAIAAANTNPVETLKYE